MPNLDGPEIINIVSKSWKELSEKEKKVYNQKQEKDLIRYQTQF